MTRVRWEMWADEYQEYYEDETPVYPDDIEEWKKEEQKVIDELRERIYRQYEGKGRVPDDF